LWAPCGLLLLQQQDYVIEELFAVSEGFEGILEELISGRKCFGWSSTGNGMDKKSENGSSSIYEDN